MKLVNISQAKAQLSALIEAAEKGEQIVILRGSRPAVAFLKVTESDLGLHPEISSGALSEFEAEIERERAGGQMRVWGRSKSEAVSELKRL